MVDLHDEIRAVLLGATSGKNRKVHGVLTAYQILHLLPAAVRESLIKKYAAPGKGAEAHFSAASAVAKAISGMGDVDVDWLDTRHLGIATGDLGIATRNTAAGNQLCGVYRLKQYGPSTW